MKQTNNAIKFLLAQYRAIFKHAYLKGLASTVALTAALVAGSAPTLAIGANLSADNWDTAFEEANATVTITGQSSSDGSSGNYQFIQFSGSKTLSEGQTLQISAGNSADVSQNFIKASGNGSAATTTISGDGTILLDVPGANGLAGGLAIYASGTSGTSTTVNIGTVTMNEGDIQLDATNGTTTTLIADTFNVGDGNAEGDGTKSCIYLGITNVTNHSGGTVQLGDENSIFNVESDGRLIFGGVSGSRSITADSITLDGGRLSSEDNASTATTNIVETHTLTLRNEAGLSVGSGSGSITLSFTDKGSEKGSGSVDETSEISLASTLTLGAGNLTIADGAKLYSDADAGAVGTLAINGSTASVTMSSTTLKGLLNGREDVEDSASGSVSLATSGTLVLTDTEAVDLADFKFANDKAAEGTIFVAASNGTIKGNDLAVSTKLKGTATGLNIEATNLTLGDSSKKFTDTSFGFASATAKNVVFENSGSALTFSDTLKLSSTKTINGVEVNDVGEIQGPVIISGSGKISVDGGTYTANDTITLASGGTLEVLNNGYSSNNKLTSSLTLGSLKIVTNTSTASTIKVSGDNAVLNLSQTEISVSGGANDTKGASITAQNNGVIKFDGEDLTAILNKAGTENAPEKLVAITAKDGGKLEVAGNLTLNYTPTNYTSIKQMLSVGAGGILEVEDSLLVNASGNGSESDINAIGLSIDETGTVRTKNLTLNNNLVETGTNTKATDVYLDGGNFEVSSKLASNNTTFILGNTSGSKNVNLTLATEQANGTGSIDLTNLELQQASGKTTTLSIAQGNWTGTSTAINVKAGELVVGSEENGVFNTASLTADRLTSAADVEVKKGSSATVNAFSQTAGNITINGVMTINGDYVAEKDGTPASYGVAITDGTIQVSGRNASLTFGNDAVQAITVSGDKVTAASNTFISNITVDQFATLKLDFDKISFSDTALKELRKTLLADNTDGTALDAGYIDLGNASIAGITVGTDGTINWDDLSKYKDITDIKTQEMSNATLVNVDSTETVNANVGNIQAEGTTQTVNLGDTVLSNANAGKGEGNFIFNADDPTTPINANITSGAHVTLENGGNVGNLTLTQGNSDTDQTILNVISSGDATTNIESINAESNTQVNINGTTSVTNSVNADDLNVDQALTVGKNITVSGDLTSTKTLTPGNVSIVNTGSITAQKLTVEGETEYAGNLDISGRSTFEQDAYLGGAQNTFGDTVTFKMGLELDRGTTTAKTIQFYGNGERSVLDVVGYANLTADAIESANNQAINITVGEEAGSNEFESWDSAPGYLTVGRLDLNGGKLTTDPEYGKAATIVAVGSFGQSGDSTAVSGNEAGNLNGQIIALRNSIVGIGVEDGDTKALDQIKSSFSRYFDANGSLDKDNVGAIAYVAKALDVEGTTSKIIVDSQNSFTSYESALAAGNSYKDKIDGSNIYLGTNSVLAVSDHAALDSTTDKGAQRAAINFIDDVDASLYAEDDAKIVLVGDGFSTRDKIMLFSDAGTNNGVLIKGNDVTVETINGLLSFTLEVGEEATGDNLSLNRAAVASSFSQASGPVKYSLISYAANDNNWADTSTSHKVDQLHGDIVAGVYSDDGETFYKKDASGNKTKLTESESKDLVAIGHTEGQKTTYTVYMDGYNSFLDNVVRNSTSGIEAEQAARLAVFGGAAQAAISAGATTYDAISGRMGVGAQTGSITFANNGQGAGLWVTPVYKNHDSDGFGAQGASYGVDMDMYGVALGGDFTLANGLRVGAAFNVGSGDADGQGTGAGVSNDFDYYGFAVYGGFTYDKLSIVGDVSYTVVDNDVEANTSVDKLTASMDSANLSVGVTGQYSFDYNGLSIVPHAGLRYTNIDLDDYTVKGSEDVAHFAGDSANIFSIPVGVTFSKDFTAGTWTIKPAFDLTLTANMGDDSIEGTVAWAGINNMSTQVESEVIDSLTYGATLGVSAQSGNLSLGLGVNYTGASSADEYSVGANARFVF